VHGDNENHRVDVEQPAAQASTELMLAGEQLLQVQRHSHAHVLRLFGSDGALCLTILVTPEGPVIQLDTGNVTLQVSGALAIDAQSIALRSREGITLDAEGDATVRVAGHLQTEARSQAITARRGDVAVYANDDVRLDGERIRMNC
jgi:hypothetical protein